MLFPPFCDMLGLVSIGYSVQAGWLPRVPLPPDEHGTFRCLPMNTMTTQFLRFDPAMYMSPGRTYTRVGVRDPARMYVRGCIYFLAPWPLYVRVHATCAPLLRHVCASTSTSMYVHVRDQNDNATYASTRWVPTIRHFLACEDVAGGSQQSGGKHFFREIRWPIRWVPAVR